MSDLPEYNGWTNYPTWNVHLWLTNDEGMYSQAAEAAARGPAALRELVEDLVLIDDLGIAADLVGWALGYVQWGEITEALVSA